MLLQKNAQPFYKESDNSQHKKYTFLSDNTKTDEFK